ncbi:hypothetical protein NZ47_13255 [Anaerovibrio lipolyticus]|uniref:Restriction endonuclease type IV Mrr domain-containing protein n=1 Tax=Anaerovibrio lipolyticus TaxID=82374 RepID=A0A0B2JR10_9FIRM|nr:restriction endonuclease [Anaerovibrio lipolyticus]KHM48352.1 hypothetical protein NZ47_13255 [Anaerovibrio lipolyticus]MBE6105257.1 restriction endonuclease [Anaerovibrio lipolyticus]
MKNTGKEYEQVVQKVFQSILDQKFVKNITVQHDVTLQGKSTTHQIDVYWEFSDGISTYATIVQAKDYSSNVSQDKLLTFKGVIDDLPNHPKGIFVTKTGYQRGAKAYAEANGILLYELRQPTDKDWEGYIRDISIKLTMFSPNVSDLKIWIDYKWLNENYKNIPKRIQMSGNDDEVFLYNGNKEKVASIYELKNSLIKKYGQENSSQYVEEIFDKPTFINYAKDGIDWLKINKISFNLSFRTYQDTIEINGDDIVKFILKDVLKDKITNIDPSLHVHL